MIQSLESLVSNISVNESNIFVNIPQQILRNEQACNVPPKKSWALPRRCNVKVVSCVRTAVSCTVDFPTILCLGLGGTLHRRRPFLTPIPFLCYTQTNHSFLATTTQGNCKKNNNKRRRSSTLKAFNVRVGILFDIASINDQKTVDKGTTGMTRNTMASCIQTCVMLWGSRRLHQTNPFLFAISLTEHKIKPKKSRVNTNSIPRVEGFWLWGGWWKDLSPNLQSNDFAETKPVFT